MNGLRPGPDRDAADDRLRDDAGADDEREREEVAALRAGCARRSTNSTSATMPTTPVIMRLPNSMSEWYAQLVGGHQGVGRAGRPGGASEARTGEPHGAARRDDRDLRDERQPGEEADPPVDAVGQPLGEAVHAGRS